MLLDFSSLFLLPLMNICPKHFYFVWFFPTHNSLGIDPTHTVYSLPPSWTQRERSASTHTVQFDQTTRWWAKVCLRLCVAGQEGTFLLCQRSRTNRNWVLLDYFKQVTLKLIFCWSNVDKFMWTSGLSIFTTCTSSYWNVRMCLLSCTAFQFLFCLKMNWNAFLKWAVRS